MKTPAQKRHLSLIISIVIFSILSAGVLVGGWLFLMNISKDTSRLYTESRFMATESSKISNTIGLYSRVSSYNSVVLEALPNTKEVSSFIADVSKIAASDSIKVTQSTLSPGDAKGKNADLSLSQTTSKGDYNELQIKYVVEGSYQNLLKMLGDLRSLRRLNNISDIIINKTASDLSGDTVTATFTDSVYIAK